MKKTCYYLIFAFISLVIWTSCEKIEANDDDKINAMELSIEANENTITLSWTRTNVSTFERYVIIRSPEPFPEEFTAPNGITFPMEEVASIEDIDENIYDDFASVLSDKVYYRVFADIGDRFLSSGSVEADIALDVLPFQHSVATFSPELDKLYFVEDNTTQLKLHTKNYKTNASSSWTLETINSYYFNIFMDNNTTENELFISNDYNDEFKTYNPEGITYKKTYYPNYDTYSIATSPSGLICAAVDDYNGSIHIYTSGNSSPIQRHNYSTYYSVRRIASISNTDNEFVEASSNSLHHYKFSEGGNLITHTTAAIGSSSLNPKITVSPDKQYFLAHRNGVIYNKDLSVFKSLDNQNSNIFYRDFTFSENGEKLYAIDAFSQKILVYDFPSLELNKEVKLGYSPLQLFTDEGKLIVTGIGFHSPSSAYRSVFQSFDF